MAVKLDYRPPRHQPEEVGFFRGVLAAIAFSLWLVLMVLVLTTSA